VGSAQDERILNERRKYRDLPFDVQPVPSSSLNELSQVLFEQEYLPNAFAPDILATNERSYEQRLAACKMISTADTPTPTVLGLLTVGNSAADWVQGDYIHFVRNKGNQWSDAVIDEAHELNVIARQPIARRVAECQQSKDRRSRGVGSRNHFAG